MTAKIPITDWAAKRWNPPPNRIQLCRWARLQRIEPPPQKVGREYYVEPDAKLLKRGEPARIAPTEIPKPAEIAAPAAYDSRNLLSIDSIRHLQALSPDAGLYFLFLAGSLQYIGLSVSISDRLLQHYNEGRISFDETRCIVIDDRNWREIFEREYIAFYKPRHNRHFIGRVARCMA